MASTLSVVIPALNEEAGLPRLLEQLGTQTMKPHEIIVADGGSTDSTLEVAREVGVILVDGGKPAAGRNAGARKASGDLILFIDADVDLDNDTIETLLTEFSRRSLDVATAHIEPAERTNQNLFACEVANAYLDLMQYVSPHAPGFCIMIRRELHDVIGGFDESVMLAEDHDYVQRAAKHGKFRVMQDRPVRTSMRRIEKEGLVTLSFKYVYSEIFVLAGKPITHVPFEYEFAAFDEDRSQPFSAEVFRERLGDAARSIADLSLDTLDTLKQLGGYTEPTPDAQALLDRLADPDLSQIRSYMAARSRLAQEKRGAVLRRFRETGDRVWTELIDSVR